MLPSCASKGPLGTFFHTTRVQAAEIVLAPVLERRDEFQYHTPDQIFTSMRFVFLLLLSWAGPGFQRAYSEVRRETLSRSSGRLLHGSGAAAATLLKLMLDPSAPAAVRVRAAAGVLEHAEKTFELEEVDVGLKRLEQATHQKWGFRLYPRDPADHRSNWIRIHRQTRLRGSRFREPTRQLSLENQNNFLNALPTPFAILPVPFTVLTATSFPATAAPLPRKAPP